MKIPSPDHTYSLLARLQVASGRQNLLVKNERGDLFLLLIIEGQNTIRSLAPMLIAFRENETFSDFIESFPFEDSLCAVFAHRRTRRDLPLARALAGAPLPVRVEAMRSLIGGLMAQNMPYPVVCDVLRPANLLCSPAGKVLFVYDLALSTDYDRDCKNKALIMLAEIVRGLFADISSPALSRFIGTLESLRFETIEEIYATFAEITDEVAATPVAAGKPALQESLETTRRRMAPYMATAISIALLAAGFFVLGQLFFNTVLSPPPADNGITEIGTVEIEIDDDETP